jgi:acid phosphatase (class A)
MRTILPILVAAVLAPAMAHAEAGKGYFEPSQQLDARVFLSAAPSAGSARDEADRRTFRETRALNGTSRWDQAVADVPISTDDLIEIFGCALGVRISPTAVPKLWTIIDRLAVDGEGVVGPAKASFARRRPFANDPGAVCQSREALDHSFDYPSGHATYGWLVGLLLAELAPDRATALLARARAYGESRIVCGAHNASAVDAGIMTGSAMLATLHGSAEFRDDMEVARRELALARAKASPAVVCSPALVSPLPR